MKLSVIIPTYKRSAFLQNCLISLANQLRLPDEIVIIIRPDDIESRNILNSFIANHQYLTIKVSYVDKPGVVIAENIGIENSQGDILCFIDDDATAEETWLKKIEYYYINYPKIGAVGGPVIPVIENNKMIEYTNKMMTISWLGKRAGRSTYVPLMPLKVDVLRGCNMSLRRTSFDKFDENLKGYWGFEDESCLQVRRNGFDILLDPDIQVYHFVAPITAEYTRGNDRTAIICANHNNTYISLKHFSPIRSLLFLFFTFIWGDSHYPGILRYIKLILINKDISISKQLIWAIKGKFEGIITLLKVLSYNGKI